MQIYPHELENYYRIALAYYGLDDLEESTHYYHLGLQHAPEWQSFFEHKFNFKIQ